MAKTQTTPAAQTPAPPPNFTEYDFGRIKGQEAVKRAITIALAGPHPILLIGHPGSGKTMLAHAIKAAFKDFPVRELTYFRHPDPEVRTSLEEEAWIQGASGADIQVEVPPVPIRELLSVRHGTTTADIRKRIDAMGDKPEPIPLHTLPDGVKYLLTCAYDELGLNPRSVTAIINVARTIAALDKAPAIHEAHLAEAIQYRILDRR